MLATQSSPFGGRTRTRAIIALRLLGESYPREVARLIDSALFGVQKALAGLERDGLVASQMVGRTRLYRLNPRYFALAELVPFLDRLAESETEIRSRAGTLRRRPRRPGKRL